MDLGVVCVYFDRTATQNLYMMTDWSAAFPNPTAQPGSITPAELATLMREKEIIKDYLVIDVRRTDFEVGTRLAAPPIRPVAHAAYF
jgi:arsenical-resistance protein 2